MDICMLLETEASIEVFPTLMTLKAGLSCMDPFMHSQCIRKLEPLSTEPEVTTYKVIQIEEYKDLTCRYVECCLCDCLNGLCKDSFPT